MCMCTCMCMCMCKWSMVWARTPGLLGSQGCIDKVCEIGFRNLGIEINSLSTLYQNHGRISLDLVFLDKGIGTIRAINCLALDCVSVDRFTIECCHKGIPFGFRFSAMRAPIGHEDVELDFSVAEISIGHIVRRHIINDRFCEPFVGVHTGQAKDHNEHEDQNISLVGLDIITV